jgi:hypothetical protein
MGTGAVQFTVALPQQRLYFFPEPHGHGSFRPTFGVRCRGSLLAVLGIDKLSDFKHDDFLKGGVARDST